MIFLFWVADRLGSALKGLSHSASEADTEGTDYMSRLGTRLKANEHFWNRHVQQQNTNGHYPADKAVSLGFGSL